MVSEALADALDPDADLEHALGLIAAAARRSLGARRSTFYVLGDDDRIERLITTERDPGIVDRLRLSIGRRREQVPIWRDVLTARGDLAPLTEVPDLDALPGVPEGLAAELGIRSIAMRRLEHSLPSALGTRRTLGGLLVGFADPHVLSARERITLETLAGVSATILANERLRSEVVVRDERDLIDLDPLTGLLNHRAFQERFQSAVDEARRRGGPLGLLLFDIDRFRAVNEGIGHDAGDRVLREVCARLRREAGPDAVLGRVGGEEIGMLVAAEPVDAWRDADRMREIIAAEPFDEAGHVTVSAGVAERTPGMGREEMMRRAEAALRWAKQHGRNVAFLCTPEMLEARSDAERANRLARSQALQSIRVLARAVDAKDPSTRRHAERVADLAVSLATALGWPTERMVRLREAGLVHDVGKVGIPDAILFKPGRLTAEERAEINRHAAIGAGMVADVLTDEQVSWVRGHHERWDGAGYPDGLAGEEIPDGARIIAVADAWDVMTSVRPYNASPLDVDRALEECRACAGTQFAPEVVEALARIVAAGALPRARDAAPVTASPARLPVAER